MISYAVGGAAGFGGLTYAAHVFYPPFTRMNYRWKVITVCMATLALATLRAEQVLNDCRRENVVSAHAADVKERSAAWAARKQHQQQQQQQHHTAAASEQQAHHSKQQRSAQPSTIITTHTPSVVPPGTPSLPDSRTTIVSPDHK